MKIAWTAPFRRPRRRSPFVRPRLEVLERRDVPSNPTYQQLAGDPPSPTTAAWFAWENNLQAQRLARVPEARATSYYFAAAGSDTAGDGSQAHPWQSVGWANGLVQASVGRNNSQPAAAADSAALHFAGTDVTVCGWTMFTTAATDFGSASFPNTLFAKPGTVALGVASGHPYFGPSVNGGSGSGAVSATTLSGDNLWHFVAGGYDSASGAYWVSVDGGAITSVAGPAPAETTNAAVLMDHNPYESYVNALQDVAVFRSAPGGGTSLMTAPAVAALWNNGYGWRYENLPPRYRATLLHWWRCNESGAADFADALGATTFVSGGATHNSVAGRAVYPAGGLALLFNRGDTFRDASVIRIDRPSVTVEAYGTGAKPLLTRFTRQYAGGWVNAGGDLWSRPEPGGVGWVREGADGYTHIYEQEDTAGHTAATAYSWSYDPSGGGTLYLNPGPGVDPNALSGGYEACPDDAAGWLITADNVRLQDVAIAGAGVNPNDTGATYAVQFSSIGVDPNAHWEWVMSGVDVTYGGYHEIGQSGDGSVLTLVGCSAGLGTIHAGDMIPYVGYAPDGGNEFLMADCEVSYGALPSYRWGATPGARGGSWGAFTHTNSAATPALAIALRTRYPDHPWQVNAATLIYGTTDGTLAGTRGYVVGEVPAAALLPPNVGLANTVFLNDTYHAVTTPRDNWVFVGSPDPSWMINCTFTVDAAAAQYGYIGYSWFFGNGGAVAVKSLNSQFDAVNLPAGDSMTFLSVYATSVAPGFTVRNTILSYAGAGPASVLPGNDPLPAGLFDHLAFHTTPAYTPPANYFQNVPGVVLLADRPRPGAAPGPSDPLYNAGAANVVDFDATGAARGADHTIGPLAGKGLPAPAAVAVGWGSRSATVTPGTVVPWAGIGRFTLTFATDVNVTATSLTVTGTRAGAYGLTSFSYDPATHAATWSLTTPVNYDRLTFTLDGGTVFTLGVLPGDYDGNGNVALADIVAIRNAIGTNNVRADINGDGIVDANDYYLARKYYGGRI